MKKIIWDLFGGGQNSVYKTIKEYNLLEEYEVYTFDITKPQHSKQFVLDLASDNVIEELSKFPKPDIITASPLCQSFSIILSMKGGGTCFWKLNEDKTLLVERSIEEFERIKSGFTKQLFANKQLEIKRLGERCINNTIKIIDYFKPKYFYIENPTSSLMWKYITLNQKDWFEKEPKKYLNKSSYIHYGFVIHKPTIFLSNVKMDLKHNRAPKLWDIMVDENGKKWSYIVHKPEVRCPYKNSRSFVIASLNQLINKDEYTHHGSKQEFSESGPASAIPHKLIYEILKCFK